MLLPYQCRTRYLPSPIRCSATDSTVVEFAGGGGLSDETMGRDAGPFFLAEGVRGLLLIPYHTTKSRDTIQKGTTPFHTIPHHTDYTIYIYIYIYILYHISYHTAIPPYSRHTKKYHTIPQYTMQHHTTPPYHTTESRDNTVRYRTRRGETVRDWANGWDGTEQDEVVLHWHDRTFHETGRDETGWDRMG